MIASIGAFQYVNIGARHGNLNLEHFIELFNCLLIGSPFDAHPNLRSSVSVLTQGPLAGGTIWLLPQYVNYQRLTKIGSDWCTSYARCNLTGKYATISGRLAK